MKVLNNRAAIVTGGAQGIGAAYCNGLANEGAHIVIADTSDGSALAQSICNNGGKAIYIEADVSCEEDNQRIAENTINSFGKIDILIANAGLYTNLERKISTEETPEEWDAVMNVNIKGVWLSAKAVIPHMEKSGYGKIINIASTAAFSGQGHSTRYAASKAAVVGITRTMAREYGSKGITINAIAPGPIETTTLSEHVDQNLQNRQKAIIGRRSIKRLGMPNDVVGLCLFLASPESDFITGQTIVVDGGSVLH